MLKVSIAMATYNGGKHLREQLQSFVLQTSLPNELVICDDCSTDETINILEEFQKTAPFKVRIIVNESNLGFAQNFSKALSLTIGDIVFLSDQDDVWFTKKIEKHLEVFRDFPSVLLVVNDAMITDENLVSSGTTKLQRLKELSYKQEVHNMGCCSSIKRDFLNFALPIPISWDHDVWFHLLAQTIDARHVVSNVLQYYRRHSSAVSVFSSENGFGKVIEMLHIVRRLQSSLKLGLKSKLEEEYYDFRLLLERIEEVILMNQQTKFSPETTAKIHFNLNKKKRAFDHRKLALSSPFLEKAALILFGIKRGYYKEFPSYRTIFKDIVEYL